MRPVAVLCGGKGTRLGGTGQKCLTEVDGRPWLAWKLDHLLHLGATDLHLLVAHKSADVRDLAGSSWRGVPVTYHYDNGENREIAHRIADLPFFHWLTYGDSILDAPLVWRPFPYIYTNDEFLSDAGTMFCWGKTNWFVPRYTRSEALHINTDQDLWRARANLRGLSFTR